MTILELPGEDSGPTCRTFKLPYDGDGVFDKLKVIINKYDDVNFCDYTIPNPAESIIHLRIQSIETPAIAILERAMKDFEKYVIMITDMLEKTSLAMNSA